MRNNINTPGKGGGEKVTTKANGLLRPEATSAIFFGFSRFWSLQRRERSRAGHRGISKLIPSARPSSTSPGTRPIMIYGTARYLVITSATRNRGNDRKQRRCFRETRPDKFEFAVSLLHTMAHMYICTCTTVKTPGSLDFTHRADSVESRAINKRRAISGSVIYPPAAEHRQILEKPRVLFSTRWPHFVYIVSSHCVYYTLLCMHRRQFFMLSGRTLVFSSPINSRPDDPVRESHKLRSSIRWILNFELRNVRTHLCTFRLHISSAFIM